MIASTLPSNLEGRIADKLKLLEDKIGSPISDFHEVLRRTEILLKNLHSGPDSELLIIVASPMIDLEDKEGKLRRALKERIDTGGKTKIVCLSPHAKGKPSDLYEFCGLLVEQKGRNPDAKPKPSGIRGLAKLQGRTPSEEEALVKEEEEKKAAQTKLLFDRGREVVSFFYQESKKNDAAFELRFGDPPFQLILAKDRLGNVQSVLYLSRKATLSQGLP